MRYTFAYIFTQLHLIIAVQFWLSTQTSTLEQTPGTGSPSVGSPCNTLNVHNITGTISNSSLTSNNFIMSSYWETAAIIVPPNWHCFTTSLTLYNTHIRRNIHSLTCSILQCSLILDTSHGSGHHSVTVSDCRFMADIAKLLQLTV